MPQCPWVWPKSGMNRTSTPSNTSTGRDSSPNHRAVDGGCTTHRGVCANLRGGVPPVTTPQPSVLFFRHMHCRGRKVGQPTDMVGVPVRDEDVGNVLGSKPQPLDLADGRDLFVELESGVVDRGLTDPLQRVSDVLQADSRVNQARDGRRVRSAGSGMPRAGSVAREGSRNSDDIPSLVWCPAPAETQNAGPVAGGPAGRPCSLIRVFAANGLIGRPIEACPICKRSPKAWPHGPWWLSRSPRVRRSDVTCGLRRVAFLPR